ncbi:MAG: hypothetical protein LBJ72_11235 [Dysgonamonadaceae bacterium]|nr:hypothetical protein [Dysgonamonadaceae bacterium]
MKKSIFRGGIIAFAILLGLLVGNIAFEAQTKNSVQKAAGESAYVVNDDEQCKNLGDFLKKEYLSNTRPLKENSAVRLFGLQEKDASGKAIELAIKLKAKKIEVEGDYLYYQLPDGLKSIVIRDVYDDNGVFVKLTLVTGCQNLPFTELWFVSLSRYDRR